MKGPPCSNWSQTVMWLLDVWFCTQFQGLRKQSSRETFPTAVHIPALGFFSLETTLQYILLGHKYVTNRMPHFLADWFLHARCLCSVHPWVFVHWTTFRGDTVGGAVTSQQEGCRIKYQQGNFRYRVWIFSPCMCGLSPGDPVSFSQI